MICCRLLVVVLLAASGFAQTISTIAGGGNGDGNAATQAFLNLPFSVAVDAQGNLLVADQNDQRIRKVDTRGIISTLAGNGKAGFADGAAAQAQFNFPGGIRVDAAGNALVADAANHRIRKIDASGNVTTVAGSGTAGDSGDSGPATSAQLRTPFGVTVDAQGNIYIADSNNHRVKRVNSAGIIATLAGTGSAGFSGDGGPANVAQLNFPLGLAVDGAGNLYIADSSNARVRKVDRSGMITTLAGTGSVGFSGDNGPAAEARLANPQDVALGSDGGLYIADAFIGNVRLSVVRRVDLTTSVITTVAGVPDFLGLSGDGGPAKNAVLFNPSGVAVDAAGRLYIADSANHRVRQVDEGGVIRTFAGGSVLDGGPATSAGLVSPSGVRVDALGNIFIADTLNHRIRRVDAAGTIRTVAGSGVPGFAGDGGPATVASLVSPQGIAFDADNNMYIADTGNHRIRKVTSAGIISTFAGLGQTGYAPTEDGGPATKARVSFPSAVALDSAGNVYIADRGNRRVRKVEAATNTITTFAGNGSISPCGISFSCGDNGPALQASFADVRDLALDAQGNLYVADGSVLTTAGRAGGFRIRQINTAGTIRTVVGNGQADASGDNNPPASAAIGVPDGIAVDRAGAIFLSDERNHRVRRAVLGGVITTLAGTTVGFSGDGGPAAAAQLSQPRGLALDAGGNLLVADSSNNRIRRITGVATVTPRRTVLISGNRQTGPVFSTLPQPLVVAVVDGTTPVEGVTVQFTASPATAVELNPAQASTDASGRVSTTVAFKGQVGPVTVTGTSSGGEPVVFTLTAVPAVNAGGAVNGASFTAAALAPGTIVSLFGQGLANSTDAAVALPLPTRLGNTTLRVETGSRMLPAPLFFVSPRQVNFLLPFEISDPAVNLVLSNGGFDSAPLTVNIADASPGVFTLSQTGAGPGAVLHADFSPVTALNPARRGETLLVFCTGLGPVNPAVPSGMAAPSDPLSRTNAVPEVSLGGVNATVDFAGLAPGFAGLYQINAQVPGSVSGGPAVPLVVTLGTRKANTVTIPVQ